MSHSIIAHDACFSQKKMFNLQENEENLLGTIFSLLKREMHEADHADFFTERSLDKEDAKLFRFGYHNHKPAIVVPFRDMNGTIQSIQYIFKNHEGHFFKQNAEGGKISGNFFALDPLDVDEKTKIYVCEGARTGLSLKKILKVALPAEDSKVFCAGPANNISAVAKVFQERFGKTTIIAAPDADDAGNQAAIECRDIGVSSFFPPKDKKGMDWSDVMMKLGLEGAAEELKVSLSLNSSQEKIVSLPVNVPFPAAKFPKEAFEFIEEVSSKMQVDIGIVGTQVLATIALACQGSGDVVDGFQSMPLSLNVLISAASGERKTSSQKEILKAVRRFEKTGFIHYEHKIKEYKIKKKRWEKMLSKKSSEEENIEDLLMAEPARPMNPKVIMQDPTIEGTIMQFKIGRKALGLFTDEGAKLFGGYSMSKEKALSAVGHLSNFWDGTPIERTRAGDEDSFTLQDKRLTACIMTQPDIFYSVWGNDLFQKQGFLPRFLIVDAKAKEGERFHVFTEEPQKLIHSRGFHQRIEHLMNFPHKYEKISLSLEARKAKVAFQKEIEANLGLGGKYHVVAGYANKSAEQATRIAGNLHLFSLNPREYRGETTEISLEEFERGKALSKWYLDEALRIYIERDSEQEEDGYKNIVLNVLKRVLREKEVGSLKVREICMRMPGNLAKEQRRSSAVKVALEALEKSNKVIQKEGSWGI